MNDAKLMELLIRLRKEIIDIKVSGTLTVVFHEGGIRQVKLEKIIK